MRGRHITAPATTLDMTPCTMWRLRCVVYIVYFVLKETCFWRKWTNSVEPLKKTCFIYRKQLLPSILWRGRLTKWVSRNFTQLSQHLNNSGLTDMCSFYFLCFIQTLQKFCEHLHSHLVHINNDLESFFLTSYMGDIKSRFTYDMS